MAPLRSIAAAVSGLILCLGDGSAGAASDSVYTRHEDERCARTGDDDPILERRCQGYDGIAVHWTNEPDNSSVSFGTESSIGGEFDARFTFAVVGDVIEWRGPVRSGKVVPVAAIVRYQLCREVGGPCTPELAIYRLHGKRGSCIAATVNGRRPDANARVREIADTYMRSFDCEKDKPRAPE
jgi:hypothetical protein